MDFSFTEEQGALREVLSRLLAKNCSFAQRQAAKDSELGFRMENWRSLAELGILALPFPEEVGGIGGTAFDVMLVMEEFGRRLALEPYLTTVVLAGGMIRDGGSKEQRAVLLPEIAAGRLLSTLASYEPRSRYDLNRVVTTAVAKGSGWRLSGSKAVVIGGPSADKFIISARTSGNPEDDHGISLFLVNRDAPGLSVSAYPTQDGGRAAELGLNAVNLGPEALVGKMDEGLPLIEKAIDGANAALCAEAVGIMSALNAETLEYLKTRKQFGVPIGSFQALKHRMADMSIASEQARSMMYLAAAKVESAAPAERRRAVCAAKALVGKCGRFIGQEAVQLHGGMGVTDELIVGHYFKRLIMINASLGDEAHHLDRFGKLMVAE